MPEMCGGEDTATPFLQGREVSDNREMMTHRTQSEKQHVCGRAAVRTAGGAANSSDRWGKLANLANVANVSSGLGPGYRMTKRRS